MDRVLIGCKYADLVVGASHKVLARGYKCFCLSVNGQPFWVPAWAISYARQDEEEAEYEDFVNA